MPAKAEDQDMQEKRRISVITYPVNLFMVIPPIAKI
jgi:hypothetical protein